MTHLGTLETSTWITSELCCAPTAMRKFNTNLIPHKIPFMILSYTLFRSFSAVKFLKLNVAYNQVPGTTVRYTYHKTITDSVDCNISTGNRSQNGKLDLLEFNIDYVSNFSKTTL